MAGLKSIFEAMKNDDDTLTKDLDLYLATQRSGDRRFDINSPSCAGKCPRANYYGRVLPHNDNAPIDPRLRRIFENGDCVHVRLQSYLESMGRLLMAEVPVIDDDYQIQGHSDGLVSMGKNLDEVAVLEIKSINDNGFSSLKCEKDDHRRQAMVYLHCLEKRRQYLKNTYPTLEDFKQSLPERRQWYADHYQHLKDGRRYTRDEKIAAKVLDHEIADEILYECDKPIHRVIFLYEDKNDQRLKEFSVEADSKLIKMVLHEYESLNELVAAQIPPGRGGRTKSCHECMYCDYRVECWK